MPFITTAAFQATGNLGSALIYPIAVPAVCFVLGLILMPETKHISIWKEVRDLKPAYLNNHVRHQVWRRTLFSENAPPVAGRFLFGPESQAACELKNDLAVVRLPRSSTALDQDQMPLT